MLPPYSNCNRKEKKARNLLVTRVTGRVTPLVTREAFLPVNAGTSSATPTTVCCTPEGGLRMTALPYIADSSSLALPDSQHTHAIGDALTEEEDTKGKDQDCFIPQEHVEDLLWPEPNCSSSTLRIAMASPKVMHAVRYEKFGGGASALQHVDILVPTPGKGEILIKLEAASLNPLDWKLQKGLLRPFLPGKVPFVPASDIAGEVVEVGSGVQNFRVGDKVSSMLAASKGGGLTEYAVTMAKMAVKIPCEVSPLECSGLPMAGLTAVQMLKRAGIKLDPSGTPANVLITAASGGVGHYAVQLAKLGKNHVTATCGARNINLIKQLGADEVLDYKTPEGLSLKSPSGKKYDAVIHCGTGIPWSTFEPNLSGKGIVIDATPTASSLLTFAIKKVTFSKKTIVPIMVSWNSADMEFLVKLVTEGKLKTVVDSTFPLAKAEEAWIKLMDGHATGKIIVSIE